MTIASRIISFLVLAAGSDQRMGERPKAFLGAGGATLLERAVARALDCADEVLVGLRPDDMERGRRLLAGRTVAVHEGGATRRRTIEALLAAASRAWVVRTMRRGPSPRRGSSPP